MFLYKIVSWILNFYLLLIIVSIVISFVLVISYALSEVLEEENFFTAEQRKIVKEIKSHMKEAATSSMIFIMTSTFKVILLFGMKLIIGVIVGV